jgi:hypothetical protein
MKNWIFFFFLIGAISFQSCESSEGNTEEAAATVEPPLPPNNAATAPESMSSVFSPNEGVFRGHDFSSTPEQVKQGESAEMVEEEEGVLTYTMDVNLDDFVDYLYYFEDGSLTKAELLYYATSQGEAAAIAAELKRFFNLKYKWRGEMWDGSENGTIFTVFMEEVKSNDNPSVIAIWEKL